MATETPAIPALPRPQGPGFAMPMVASKHALGMVGGPDRAPPYCEGTPPSSATGSSAPLRLFLFLSLPTHTWAEPGARVRQGAGGNRALLLLTGDLASLGGMLGERPSRDEADLGCERAARLPGRSSGCSAPSLAA